MRFITEFEITEKDNRDVGWKKALLFNQKSNRQIDMGKMLADSFGWANPVLNNPLRYRLEIEAFPMDKWLEFRKRLWDALPDHDQTSRTKIINALDDLQSYAGK